MSETPRTSFELSPKRRALRDAMLLNRPAPPLSEADRRRLLVEWNHTAADYPRDKCVHELFEAQAWRTPNQVAVTQGARRLTYLELNQKANGLAHHLRSLGVGPETLAGLYMERSPELVIGILGILKAGGAYVPLDPSYPRARLSYMLADSSVTVLVTERSLAANLPAGDTTAVLLDPDSDAANRPTAEGPATRVAPDNLVYVIYTSGSTGTPKGIPIEHRSLGNLLTWMQRTFQLTPDDRVLQSSSFSFDVSIAEFFTPLLAGAQLVMPGAKSARDPLSVFSGMIPEGVTILGVVPSVLELLLERGVFQTSSRLRAVWCVGEALSPKLRDHFHQQCRAELWNLYGPTECCIYSSAHRCSRSDEPDRVPIGRPIANTELYILDDRLQSVSVGASGQLHIGGDGLARGYLNRRELTVEKFIPHPFGSRPGARLYRTGDLARFLPDGRVEYLGRLDHQVKIRGSRVEPGEVEAVLATHRGIRAAAVSAWDDERGAKQLVAYVVPVEQGSLTAGQLRAFLGEKVPDYMVPARWMFLESMPLAPNGKLDRAALPPPGRESVGPATPFVPPRTLSERRLAGVWAKALRMNRVSIHDSFFEIGGHSLLAFSLLAEIEREFGVELPLRVLLETPTIEQLAGELLKQNRGAGTSVLVPLRKEGSKAPLFLIHAAAGDVLFYRDLARRLDPGRPVYGLTAVGLHSSERPLVRVEEMASRYLSEIRAVQPYGPYHLGGFCLGASIAFEIAQQIQTQGEEVGLAAFIEEDTPWRTVTSPLSAIAYHLRNLARTPRRKWIVYFTERSQYRFARMVSPLVFMTCALYRILGRPLPLRLRALQVRESNHRAGMIYEPRPYRGKIICFRGQQNRSNSSTGFWRQVTVGGIDVHDIPGSGIGILKEPHVRILASKLAEYLDPPSTEGMPRRPS